MHYKMFLQACFFGLLLKTQSTLHSNVCQALFSPVLLHPKKIHISYFSLFLFMDLCVCISPLRETSGISITQEGNEASLMKHKKIFALNFWCKFQGKKTPWLNSHFHEDPYKPCCLWQHGSFNLTVFSKIKLVITNQVLPFPSMKSASLLIIM